MTARPSADDTSTEPGERIRARLFDADRTDRVIDLETALRHRVSSKQLLWLDVDGGLDQEVASTLGRKLGLDRPTVQALVEPGEGPYIAVHRKHVHLRIVTTMSDMKAEHTEWLEIVAAPNVVITGHRKPVLFLRRIDERIEADATVGALDAASFARSIIDSAITTYFEAVDSIEAAVDDLDTRSLRPNPDDDLLPDLVALRRRIGGLRRSLSDQREVFAALAAADFSTVAEDEDVRAGFVLVAGRFEAAIHSVEDSRDLLLGSFDVFMTRTAQRTNDVMKVLALATVLLLPGSLIAGLLGMNVMIPLSKDDPSSFWVVLAAIAILAVAVLVVATRNHWIRWRAPRTLPPDPASDPSGH
jgi:magnesium transporter